MKKEIYLKKSTRDAIKKNMKDDLGLSFKASDLKLVKKRLESFPYDELVFLDEKPNKYGICHLWLETIGLGSSEEKEVRKFINSLQKEVAHDSMKDARNGERYTYKGYNIIDMGDQYVITDMHGTTISTHGRKIKSKLEAEGIIDDLVKGTKKDSYEYLGWISDYDLLKEDDFYDRENFKYWRQSLKDLTDTRVKMKDRIDFAEMMLDYLDDFKNKNVKEEVASDLRKFISENHIRDSKIKDYGLESIKIPGYRGTWYEIDKKEVNGKTYYLLEHEYYGDETAHLFVEKVGSTFKVLDDESYDLSINELIRDFA